MSDLIRFGIMGCGGIAHKFARGIPFVKGATLSAVAASDPTRARNFAQKYDVPNVAGSYLDLVEQDWVDVVYVATTHNFHFDCVNLALNHGKAVLCEKPICVNARQTESLIEKARSKKLFLMEAMWTRFLPAVVKVRQWLDEKRIGQIKHLRADFGCNIGDADSEGRMFNPALAGGALLDMGCYPLSLASMVFNGAAPDEVTSLCNQSATGVDEQSAYLLRYGRDGMAVLSSSFTASIVVDAQISGSHGRIHLQPWFIGCSRAVLYDLHGTVLEDVHLPIDDNNGFSFETQEVVNCLRDGKTESSVMPLDESLILMRTMDKMRDSWGLRYPGE